MASWVPGVCALLALLLVPARLGGIVADDSDWVKLPNKCEGELGFRSRERGALMGPGTSG